MDVNKTRIVIMCAFKPDVDRYRQPHIIVQIHHFASIRATYDQELLPGRSGTVMGSIFISASILNYLHAFL